MLEPSIESKMHSLTLFGLLGIFFEVATHKIVASPWRIDTEILVTHILTLQLPPYRTRKVGPTPCPIEFRRLSFQMWNLNRYNHDSVSRLFLVLKSSTRHLRATLPPSSSQVGLSAFRATSTVLVNHFSTQPGNGRACKRVWRPHLPVAFTNDSAMMPPPGTSTWARIHWSWDVTWKR